MNPSERAGVAKILADLKIDPKDIPEMLKYYEIGIQKAIARDNKQKENK